MGKAKKIFLGIGIAFAILIVLGAISTYTNPNQSPHTVPIGEKENPASLNQNVTVGDIAYKVNSVYATNNVANELGGQNANGVYIVVNMDIENNGKQTEGILDSYFKLVDSQGREFATDQNAWMYLKNNVMFKQLQPNLPTKGQVIFDVPITAESYTLKIIGGLNSFDTTQYIHLGKYPETIPDNPLSFSPNSTASHM